MPKRSTRARTMTAGVICLALVSALFAATGFDRSSANSLRTNITWLAADQRAGRMTPSPGLEASANYIGAQFRAAGLAAGGDDGTFFQTARFVQLNSKPDDFSMMLETAGRRVTVRPASMEADFFTAFDFKDSAVVRLPRNGRLPEIAGQIVAGDEGWAAERPLHELEAAKPALILLAMGGRPPDAGSGAAPLIEDDPSAPPVIRIYSRAAADLLPGRGDLRLTLHSGAPARHDVALRNVAGILGGSDPALRDQFVILSAHYDHLGVKPPGPGNRIFHGANDDASGVASLIEIAKALAASSPHPRRSVLFLAFFGEEEGLLGSGYYVRHPLIPLVRTIADINLEQLGRTDTSDGPEMDTFAFSGPSYSNLPQIMTPAAKAVGTAVYRKETADDYFDRSDNYSFALAGVVDHTIAVAFEFSDYHAVSDEADKIDYGNLAKVDRGIAAGVAAVADAAEIPQWSDIRATRAYREAAR